jgi:uncharacterized protein
MWIYSSSLAGSIVMPGLKDINEIIVKKRDEILRIAELRGAKNLRVFGSMARGDSGPDSDIDLLVEMEESRTLFDMAELTLDLEELLGRKVHVCTPDSIYWLLRKKILREAKPI